MFKDLKGYPESVQIMTDSGFKFFKDVKSTDLILQINNRTLVGKYTDNFKIQKTYFKNDLLEIQTSQFNIICSLDTELVITSDLKQRRGVNKVPIRENIPAHNVIPLTCTTNSKLTTDKELSSLSNAQLTLAAILIQNTYTVRDYDLNSGVITLHIETPKIYNLLRRTLTYLDIESTEEKRVNSNYIPYSIFKFKLPNYLNEIYNKHSLFQIPKEWLNTLELESKKHLVTVFSKFYDHNKVISKNLYTVKRIQELACTSNIGSCNVINKSNDFLSLYVSSELLSTSTKYLNEHKKLIPYSGYLYNIETPSGLILIKYKGTTCIASSLLIHI